VISKDKLITDICAFVPGDLAENIFWFPALASMKMELLLHYERTAPLLGFIRGGEYILTLDYIKDYIERSYHEVQDWITRKF
jgi:hypothetical protein